MPYGSGCTSVGAAGWWHRTLDLWRYFHQLDDAAALARACPDVSVVLDHCGGPIGSGPYAGHRAEVFQRWQQGMQTLGVYPNVHVKLGGLAMAMAGFGWRERALPPSSLDLAQAWQPYVEVCLDNFGAARCMFESNFPVDRTGCYYQVLWNVEAAGAAPVARRTRGSPRGHGAPLLPPVNGGGGQHPVAPEKVR